MHTYAICRSFIISLQKPRPVCDSPCSGVFCEHEDDHANPCISRFRQERQRPDTPAGFPARLASRWLDGLIAERGLSRNTVAAYRQDLDALRDFLDELETPLSGLDDENITLFIAWLRKRGDATRTLARRISSLRSFLAWCVERGSWPPTRPPSSTLPKLPSLLPDVLTPG